MVTVALLRNTATVEVLWGMLGRSALLYLPGLTVGLRAGLVTLVCGLSYGSWTAGCTDVSVRPWGS